MVWLMTSSLIWHVTGLRLDLSFTYDLTQASILGFQDNYVDVYSNSWGPLETGFTVGGPGYLTRETLKYEAEHVRAITYEGLRTTVV